MKYDIGCNCLPFIHFIHSDSFRIKSVSLSFSVDQSSYFGCQLYSCLQLIIKLYVGAKCCSNKTFYDKGVLTMELDRNITSSYQQPNHSKTYLP